MKTFTLYLTAFLLFLPLSSIAQRQITSFIEKKITNGFSATIDGKLYTEPDIIYTEDGTGGYSATRLTVVPKGLEAVTLPYLNNVTAHSACINWKTSSDATGSILKLGTRKDALDKILKSTGKELAANYFWNTVKIENLSPATTYYYKVESNGVLSAVYSFHTMPENGDKEKIRILLIGDHQHNEHSDYEWMLKAAHRKANELYGEAAMNEHFRLLLNVGDQVDGGRLTEYELKHLYKSRLVMSSLPIMTTVGNHETIGDSELKLYDGHYSLYGQLDYQGIKSGTAKYYAYQIGSLLIIVLNSDGTTSEQKAWLKQVIKAADIDPSVTFIMASQHRPLYAEQWNNDVSPWMKNQIMPILASSPKFVLDYAGHHHLYARGQMTEYPVYHIISGGGVGTTAEVYEQLWGNTPDNKDEDAVQKTIDHWTYQIVEFDPVTKTMTVDSYSIGNSRLALDNVLVDRFSRCLSDNAKPDTPHIQEIEANKFPFAIKQQKEISGLHSAQYQMAEDESFQQIVLDRVITYENFYDVDENFMPKNLNSSGIVTSLILEDGSVAKGTYFVRCRNRNMNLNWSEYSNAIKVNVTAQSTKPSLQLDKRIYGTDEEITISYENAPMGQGAWVGLYEYYKKPAEGQYSKEWAYTTDTNGTLKLKIAEPGEYYAVLFSDGGYNVIAGRIPFIVTDNCNETDKQFSLKMKEYVLAEDEDIVVELKNAPLLPKDWVGVYNVNQVREDQPVVGGIVSYVWAYAKEVNQELNLCKGSVNQKPTKGYYFVEYFFSEAYTSFFSRDYFVIGKPAFVSAEKNEYVKGETIMLHCNNLPGWEKVSLSINDADGNMIKNLPLDCGEDCDISVNEINLTEGNYTAYVTYGGQYKAISEEFAFVVSAFNRIESLRDEYVKHPEGKFVKDDKLVICKNDKMYSQDGIRLK